MPEDIQSVLKSAAVEGDPWLLLFDIDGTLVDAGSKGLRALKQAAEDVFGGEAPALDLAGATDLGVIREICGHFNEEVSDEKTKTFFDVYHGRLKESLAGNPEEGRVLDGVFDWLEKLCKEDHAQLALLTGNTEDGAMIKLAHFQLDHHFQFGAFGSDHEDRNQLGPIALKRASERTGKHFTAERTLVIGDTPKDIACAHAMGGKCLAVATGRFSAEELEDAGADFVVGSLTEAFQ